MSSSLVFAPRADSGRAAHFSSATAATLEQEAGACLPPSSPRNAADVVPCDIGWSAADRAGEEATAARAVAKGFVSGARGRHHRATIEDGATAVAADAALAHAHR
jgi:hypothetical protein